MSEVNASQPSVFDGLSHTQLAELRTDHAGELGAVWIYKGILSVTKDRELREFAEEHLATESQHFRFFHEWDSQRPTKVFSPLWKIAGWMLGAIPALFGRNAVYVTIDAVETFVVQHYEEQLNLMPSGLRTVLGRIHERRGRSSGPKRPSNHSPRTRSAGGERLYAQAPRSVPEFRDTFKYLISIL